MKRVFLLSFIVLSAAGCVTPSRPPASYDLSADDMIFADALAHYTTGLIKESEMGWFSDEALSEFIRAADLDPSQYHLYSRVALAYLYRGDTGRAIDILQQACRRAPKSPQPWIDLATIYHMTSHLEGHVDKAIAAYRDALRMAPERTFLYQELAKLLLWQKKDSEAFAVLRKAFKKADNQDLLRAFSYDQARRLLISGQVERAAACFQLIADRVPPEKLGAVFFLHYGSARERSGDRKKAESIFEQGLRIHPDTHEILNYLAYMWAEKGVNLDKALAYVTRALEKEPENGAYIDTLGWIYFQQGRPADALVQIRKANAITRDDPTIMDHLGDCLQATRDTPQAVKYWRQSFLMDPDNENVARKLKAGGVDVEELRQQIEARKKEQKAKAAEAGDNPDIEVQELP